MILLLAALLITLYATCRASGSCSEAEREREDEILYLELLLRSDEEPRV